MRPKTKVMAIQFRKNCGEQLSLETTLTQNGKHLQWLPSSKATIE